MSSPLVKLSPSRQGEVDARRQVHAEQTQALCLLATCRTIYNEAVAVYYGERSFVCTESALPKLLRSLSCTRRRHISSLEIYVEQSPFSAVHYVIFDMPKLRSINLLPCYPDLLETVISELTAPAQKGRSVIWLLGQLRGLSTLGVSGAAMQTCCQECDAANRRLAKAVESYLCALVTQPRHCYYGRPYLLEFADELGVAVCEESLDRAGLLSKLSDHHVVH